MKKSQDDIELARRLVDRKGALHAWHAWHATHRGEQVDAVAIGQVHVQQH
jgi:hypothetical protein